MSATILPFPSISVFPVKTKNPKHTPARHIRMDEALVEALEQYGKRSGIGNVSSVIRFACTTLLRQDTALQAKPEAKAS